jgi:hypothetical protein
LSTSSAPYPSIPSVFDSVGDFSSSIRWLLKAWDTPLSVLPTSLLELQTFKLVPWSMVCRRVRWSQVALNP